MTVSVRVDPATGAAFIDLANDLRDLPDATRRRVARRLRTAGEATAAQARANASWSTRIPAALTLRTATRGRNPGVMIVADAGRAPHARVYEGMVRDVFRHPVFGMDRWVSQDARPYLRPAARATGGVIVEAVSAAVAEALAETIAD